MASNIALRERIIQILEKAGIDVTYKKFTTDNIMIRCPFAKVGGHTKEFDSNPSLGLKISDKGFLFNCLACHRRGRSFVEFIEMLKEYELIDNKVDAYTLQNSISIKFPAFGENYVLNPIDKTQLALPPIDNRTDAFWKYNCEQRGLNKLIVDRADLRYDKFMKQIIFPCYDYSGTLQGMVAHYINKKLPKYSNKYFDKGQYLYLEWLARKNTIGIITEGMYDTLVTFQHIKALRVNDKYSVVGTFGNEVSQEQMRKMAKLFNALFMYGDNDVAGIQMENTIYENIGGKIPMICRLDYIGKDPAEVSLGQFQKILASPRMFGTYA